MKFGERLSRELELRGVTQSALARMLGISKQAVNQWVNSTTTPGPQMLMRLEDVLELRRGELLGELGYRNPDDEPVGHVTPEEAIRRDPEIAAEDKRALLRIVAGFRRAFARSHAEVEVVELYDVDLNDPDERDIWEQTALPQGVRWGFILRLRELKAEVERGAV